MKKWQDLSLRFLVVLILLVGVAFFTCLGNVEFSESSTSLTFTFIKTVGVVIGVLMTCAVLVPRLSWKGIHTMVRTLLFFFWVMNYMMGHIHMFISAIEHKFYDLYCWQIFFSSTFWIMMSLFVVEAIYFMVKVTQRMNNGEFPFDLYVFGGVDYTIQQGLWWPIRDKVLTWCGKEVPAWPRKCMWCGAMIIGKNHCHGCGNLGYKKARFWWV